MEPAEGRAVKIKGSHGDVFFLKGPLIVEELGDLEDPTQRIVVVKTGNISFTVGRSGADDGGKEGGKVASWDKRSHMASTLLARSECLSEREEMASFNLSVVVRRVA